MLDIREGEDLPIPFEQRTTARGAMARAGRERWRQVLGDDADDVSDAEFVDHWDYMVFPNLHPWGGYNRIVYRFRPNGDRHDESIFEVMFLTPYRGERPPTAQITHLDFGEPWANAPELQTLGLVMEQDTFNMEAVQRGLETTRPELRASVDATRRGSWPGATTCWPNGSRAAPVTAAGPAGAIRHPLIPNAFYADNGDGTVRVTRAPAGGGSARDGSHIEGTLFEADPELCVWVSAPRPASHHRISRVIDMPAER